MLSHSVYVGGINNLSDARYAAGMFVDQIGLPVGGPNGLSREKFNEVTQWVSGVKIIGQLQGEPDFLLSDLAVDAWEVSDSAMWEWLKTQTDLPIGWRAPVQLLENAPKDAAFWVLEGGSIADISLYPEAFWEINADLQASEVWKEFSTLKLALQGGQEERPGFSNFGDLIDILEALELE